jgi:hypothetical protein
MGDFKKQHFVPQSYLRRFSKDKKQIRVYDKILKKSFSDGIRNVAQESHFYKIPDEMIPAGINFSDEDKLVFEKVLQNFEGELNQLIEKIFFLPPGIEIPKKIRESLSILIAVQLLRTRSYRKLVKEASEKFVQALARDLTKKNFGEKALKYTPKVKASKNNAFALHSQLIFDFDNLAKMAEVFYNHIWQIGYNKTTKLFYTSDNPVVMHTPLRSMFRGVGIKSPGIEIAYPLSSRYILILVDSRVYATLKFADGKGSILEAENVEYYNSLQVIHSDRQIFCEEADFDLPEDMVKKDPDLSNPDSDRIVVNNFD